MHLGTPHFFHGQDVQSCPEGFSWYSCGVNSFQGCCSIDPCAESVTCPNANQPLSLTAISPPTTTISAISSNTIPSDTASPETTASAMASFDAIPSTPTPTAISSVGAPLASSLASSTDTGPISSKYAFITTLAPSQILTVVAPQPSSGNQSSLPPAIPSVSNISPSDASSSSTTTTTNSSSSNNSQSFPIGLIAGIVTGFSILILVMGLMFVILWRNKKIKIVGDTEATQMREQRSSMRAYYMPPASRYKTVEPEVATTPWRVAASPPPRSSSGGRGDINKPWPPMPRASEGAVRTSVSPLRGSSSAGGRSIDHPDPLRANRVNTPVTETRSVVPFTPTTAALLLQHGVPLPSQSPREGPVRFSPQRDISPPSSESSGDGPSALKDSATSNPDRDQDTTRSRQRDSELTRADSTAHSHFALSPPPKRRPPSSSSEATKSTGEGRVSRTPGLRLSGVSQGAGGPADEGGDGQREESVEESEAVPMVQRATWNGESKDRGRGGSPMAQQESRRRRFSQ